MYQSFIQLSIQSSVFLNKLCETESLLMRPELAILISAELNNAGKCIDQMNVWIDMDSPSFSLVLSKK